MGERSKILETPDWKILTESGCINKRQSRGQKFLIIEKDFLVITHQAPHDKIFAKVVTVVNRRKHVGLTNLYLFLCHRRENVNQILCCGYEEQRLRRLWEKRARVQT